MSFHKIWIAVDKICGEVQSYQQEVGNKRQLIYKEIREVMSEFGLSVTEGITGNLDDNNVELCETGSTKRGTGITGDNDFDFMMRIDRSVFDSSTLEKIKQRLLAKFNKTGYGNEITGNGDFRLTNVQLGETQLDIDITFVMKTNKINYSTDMCIEDRFETIRKKDEEKYYVVLANIVLAKKLLKKAQVYKPARGLKPQGGLGGVGVENWILQNGGSLYDAALSFIEASKDLSFYDFKNVYAIWDFGENHLSVQRSLYLHDNFVNNMSEEGYYKMKKVLKEYVSTLENSYSNDQEGISL